MKKIFMVLTALLLLSTTACGGGGGDTSSSQSVAAAAAAVLDSYTTALTAGDTEKALGFASQSSKARQKEILEAAAADPYYREELAKAIKNATKVSETDQIIFYKMTMVTKDGKTVEDTFRLILEDGSWKLTGF